MRAPVRKSNRLRDVAWDGGVHAFLLDMLIAPALRRGGFATMIVQEAVGTPRQRLQVASRGLRATPPPFLFRSLRIPADGCRPNTSPFMNRRWKFQRRQNFGFPSFCDIRRNFGRGLKLIALGGVAGGRYCVSRASLQPNALRSSKRGSPFPVKMNSSIWGGGILVPDSIA